VRSDPRWRRLAGPLLLVLAGCAPRSSTGESEPEAPLTHLLRIAGSASRGELGFRFSPPLDCDGDGIADLALGARYTDLELTGMGTVTVWSSRGGSELAHWEGHVPDGLFGHAVLMHPDIDGDGLADVVASAPNGKYYEVPRGAVFARSPRTKRLLWSRLGEPLEGIGWHLSLAADLDRDGIREVLAGAPGGTRGKVMLLAGRNGSVLRAYTSALEHDQFGWYAVGTGDLDGDGLGDVLVGAPSEPAGGVESAGAVHLLSISDGRELRAWHGGARNGQLGEVLAALPDIDGDGKDDVAIGAPFRPSSPGEETQPGEAFVYSGATGKLLWRWTGRKPGELYGRMVAHAGDLDGDGAADVAVGAPWHLSPAGQKVGRFEVRSGRTGAVLAEAEGNERDLWLGWHIEAGASLGPAKRRGLVVSSIWSGENGLAAAGAVHAYVYPESR